MDTIQIKNGLTKMIAHRGLSGLEAENTAAAFVAAGNRDYYGIETDVHRTKDGKYIIIHDDTTKRVADRTLSVEKNSFARLRSIKLKDKDGTLRGDLCFPSLEEYLKICKRYGKVAVLELKNCFEKKHIEEIIDIVLKNYELEKMIFISFFSQNMFYLRKLLPTARLQYLYSGKIDNILLEQLLNYKLDLDIQYERLTRENIELLHKNGILVNCWTCDDPKVAQTLVDWKVDFITTNILQ